MNATRAALIAALALAVLFPAQLPSGRAASARADAYSDTRPAGSDKANALAWIAEARGIHEDVLADELAGRIPRSKWETWGGPGWQRMWIARYSVVLKVLGDAPDNVRHAYQSHRRKFWVCPTRRDGTPVVSRSICAPDFWEVP